MTPEEQEQQDNLNAYNQTIGKANNELNKFGNVSNETAAKLSQFQSSLTRDFKALGNSGINLAKQLNNGAIGASVFNDSIGSMSDVIGDLVGMIPYFGTALKTAIKGVSEYTQAVNKQTDALFDSYEQMSKVGAAGAGGIQSVYDNLKKLNLGVNELDKFVAIVGENSDTLRKFGQTVGGGLTEFANVANSLQQGDVGRQFREMGISVDEINNGIASYMKMQTIGGVRQKMSTDQLINASKDYIREVDLLSKVTGQTRKQQEEAMESAMAEERFAAYRTELQLKANMGDKAAAAQLQQVDILNKSLAKEAPKLRIGMLNLMSGTLDNPEAQKIARGLPEVAAKLQKGAFTANDVLNTASKEASRTIGKSGEGFGIGLGKLGIFNDNFGDLNDTVKLANMNEYGTLEERMAAAAAAQKVTDENTKDANKTRDNNRTARDSLNDLINAGIGPVTTAMKGMSTATETTITAMEKMANMMGVETKKRDVAPTAATPRPAQPRTERAPAASPRPAQPRTEQAPAPRISGEMQTDLLSRLSSSGITDQRAQANVLAQFEAESKGRADAVESLNYSAERLVEVFPEKFKNLQDAQAVVAQGQEAVGNRVYGGRMGNAQDEGFKYRGRGLVQLTGKDNYKKIGEMLGINLVDQPDLAANPEIAKQIAVAYVKEKQKSGTDLTDIAELGKAIGYAGGQKETAKRADIAEQYLKINSKKETAKQGNLAEKFLQDGAVPEGYTQTQMEPGTAARQRQEMWAARQKRIRDAEARKAAPKMANGGVIQATPGGVDIVAGEAGKNEAVVPLPDGRTIPVQIAGSDEQLGLMSAQLSRLDDIVRVMQNQLGVSQKLLQYAQ
jgi:predicted chitinase